MIERIGQSRCLADTVHNERTKYPPFCSLKERLPKVELGVFVSDETTNYLLSTSINIPLYLDFSTSTMGQFFSTPIITARTNVNDKQLLT
jgi:hypothetical protein